MSSLPINLVCEVNVQHIAKKMLIFVFLIWTINHVHGEYLSYEGIASLNLTEQSTLIKQSKSCGSFYVLRNNFSELDLKPDHEQYFSFGGEQVLKYKRKGLKLQKRPTGDLSYRTPYGQVYINQSMLSRVSYSKYEEYLKESLLVSLRERAKLKLAEEFSLSDNSAHPHPNKTIEKIHKTLFKEHNSDATKQIRVILAIFPELVDEIIYNEKDELRPLLCLMKLKQHNIKMFNRWTNLLIPPALILGVASAAVGSAGLILPPLAIAAGVSACLLGIRDIGMGIYWLPSREKAAYVAGKMKLFYKESKITLKHLRKKQKENHISEDEVKLLTSLEKLHAEMKQDRIKTLKKVVRAKNFNRLLITFGVLNAGFNGLNLTGDPTLLADLPGLIFSSMGKN